MVTSLLFTDDYPKPIKLFPATRLISKDYFIIYASYF